MEFTQQKAIYLQIADYLCERIVRDLQPGDKIESVRECAALLEVNPNTVVRAYSQLLQNNIIEMRRGVGYFLCDDAKQRVKAIKRREFLETTLPELFHAMKMLDIDIKEVTELYQQHSQ